MESNFGRFSGVRPTIAALATLAWDPRRATYFRRELFNALEILNRGDIDLPRLKGSWAGAMGQPQFMPSSYLKRRRRQRRPRRHLEDQGRRLCLDRQLPRCGWKDGSRGPEVSLTDAVHERIAQDIPMRTGSCKAEREMTAARPLTEWAKLGVKAVGGKALPKSDLNASLVRGHQRHFLVYANYNALLGYNCSNSYAIGLGLLADRIPALK
jgi:membrane-bound lytic murein transglycosylase B